MQSIFEKIRDLKNRLTIRFPKKRYDNKFSDEVKAILDESKYIQVGKINVVCEKYEAIIKRGR